MELAVGSKKIVIFYRKTEKTARRRPTKHKIARFLLFARKRNAESPVFYSSLASETQNRPFSTLRSQAKRKIAHFLLFARKRNAESPVFCPSLASETQNHPFSTLRSQAKRKITRFLRFRPPSKATSPAHSMKTECLLFGCKKAFLWWEEGHNGCFLF